MKPVSFMRTAPTELGEVPTDGYVNPLSLDTLLVARPTSTFFMRVGKDIPDEHEELGVTAHDLLVVDRATVPTLGKLVIAAVDGELVLMRLTEHESSRYLVTGKNDASGIELTDDAGVTLWGTVTAVVRNV